MDYILSTVIIGFLTLLIILFGKDLKKKYQNSKKDQKIHKFNQYVKDTYFSKNKMNISDVFEEIKQDGISPNIQTYTILITILIKIYDLRQIVKLIKLFQQNFGAEKTELYADQQYTLLQQIFKGLNHSHSITVEDQKSFFVDLIQLIEQKNIVYFVEQTIKQQVIEPIILMFQYYKDIQNAQFSTLKAFKQIHPYLLSKYYKNLINKYLQLEQIEDHIGIILLEIVLKMNDMVLTELLFQKIDQNFQDKTNLYQTLVRGLVTQKQYKILIKYYEKMCQIPDLEIPELVYGQIIDCCVKCGELEKAKQVLESSDKSNTVMYTTLIKGFSKQKQFQQAYEVFKNMKENKNQSCKPNVVTYNSLLECAVQAQEQEKLKEIFQEIIKASEDKNSELQPDLITYSTYIKGLCKGKQIKEALNLFEEVRKNKTKKIDEVLYNSLLDGLYKAGELEVCLKVYEYMKEDEIKLSNVTYSILIKLYNQLEKYQSAFDVLEIMKTRFIKPGIIVYTCIVQTCVKTKNMTKLVEIYEQMKEQDVIGDSVFYNTLISGMMYNRYIRSALDITLDTLKNKIFLNTDVYTNLMKNLIRVYERRASVCNKNDQQQTSLSEDEVEKGLLELIQAFKLNKVKIDSETFHKAEHYIFKKDKKPIYKPLEINKQNSDNSKNQGIYNRQKNKSFFQRRPVQNQLEQKVTYVLKKTDGNNSQNIEENNDNNNNENEINTNTNNANNESARKRAKTFTQK